MSAAPALRAESAIRRLTGCALAAVGPMAALGYLLHLPPLIAFGTLSAASPLPIVFGAVAGHEYWATRYVLDVEMRDGRHEHREVARGHFGRLGGPHRARMLLALPLVLAPVLPDDAWMRPVVSGLCRGGRLARVLELDGAVRRMEVTAVHRAGPAHGERHYGVWCPDR